MDLQTNSIARRTRLAGVLFAQCCLLGLTLGCQSELPSTHPDFATQFADAPRLRKTANLKLRRELKEIERAGGLPSQLQNPNSVNFQDLVKAAAKRDFQVQSDETASVLATAFTLGQIKSLKRRTENAFPKYYPPWPEETRRLADIRTRYEDSRVAFRRSMRLPKSNLGVEFHRGLMAEHAYIDSIVLGCELEAYYGIEMLQRGKELEALEATASMLLGARRLASMGHPSPRIAAIDIHKKAIWMLRAVCDRKQRSPQAPSAAMKLVHQQLANWPNESRVWLGDRSDGVHAYEMVRDGYILALFSQSELDKIRNQVGMERFQKTIGNTIDKDELFYLDAMRRIIVASNEPYFKRTELFEELTSEMERLRSTEQHPMIADWLLLPHVMPAQREMAADLARFQALALGLSELAEQPSVRYRVNPLTGDEYRFDNDAESIRVFGVGAQGADEPVVLRRAAARVGRLP